MRSGVHPWRVVTTTIATVISLMLSGRQDSLLATMEFDTSDPFAVSLTFHGNESSIEWVFARSLVIDGLQNTAGSGDVQIWLEDAGMAIIRLESPSGTAVLRTPVLPLTVFVDDMLSLTPLGHELDGLNIYKELNDLLAE